MRIQPTDAPMRARLRDVDDFQAAMRFHDLTCRELAVLCGDARHRSTVGHLHAGTRNTCTIALAKRIEKILRVAPGSLFTPLPRSAIVVTTATSRPSRKKAAV